MTSSRLASITWLSCCLCTAGSLGTVSAQTFRAILEPSMTRVHNYSKLNESVDNPPELIVGNTTYNPILNPNEECTVGGDHGCWNYYSDIWFDLTDLPHPIVSPTGQPWITVKSAELLLPPSNVESIYNYSPIFNLNSRTIRTDDPMIGDWTRDFVQGAANSPINHNPLSFRADHVHLDDSDGHPLSIGRTFVAQPQLEVEYSIVREFEIAFTTFIPGDYIRVPSFHPAGVCLDSLGKSKFIVNNGNDRGFDPLSNSFKTRQSVTVAPASPDYIVRQAKNLVGETREYAGDALDDGEINELDDLNTALDCHLFEQAATGGTAEMSVTVVPYGLEQLFVNLTTNGDGPNNPLVGGSPSIDWNIDLFIDGEGNYTVSGNWDGFPSAELYINNRLVWSYDAGPGPGYDFSALKLINGIGEKRVSAAGQIIHDINGMQFSPFVVPEPRASSMLLAPIFAFLSMRGSLSLVSICYRRLE